MNWLTFDPYEYGWHSFIFQSPAPGEAFWIRYPIGDGYLIYPGKPIGHDGPVASIRLKQVREGITDHSYLSFLQRLIRKAESEGREVPDARMALQQALDIVDIPSEGIKSTSIAVQIFNGRYSTRLLKDPDQLLGIREQIAIHIEQLVNE